jgi:hypothetical protein
LYSTDISPCIYYMLHKFEVLKLCNFLHRISNIANFHFQVLEYASMYDFVLVLQAINTNIIIKAIIF